MIIRRAFSSIQNPTTNGNGKVMMNSMKTALVTGGSTGLGYAMSKKFAKSGMRVIIASRNLKRLEESANKLIEETGNKQIHFAQLDLTQQESIPKFLDEIQSIRGDGKVADILINNSAANFISPTERLSMNAFSKIINTVFTGTACLTLEHCKLQLENKQPGTTLSISASYASTGSAYVLPSACGKAALECMTKSMAAEWGKRKLRFLSLALGPIYTEGAFSRLDPKGTFSGILAQRLPAGKLGNADELADLVEFLTSGKCDWMNGSCIDFDGGEKAVNGSSFNLLSMLSDRQWDEMAKLIRKTK